MTDRRKWQARGRRLPFDSRSLFKYCFLTVLLPVFFTAADVAGATTRVVGPGGDLQQALDAAQPGDTIVLQAGTSYVGGFKLPLKPGTEWITIQSSAIDGGGFPVAGERISPVNAVLMPKILAPGANLPALRTAAGAHHYRFIGIEFAPADADVVVGDLIKLGGDETGQTRADQVPHHLVFDRCYVHGLPGVGLKRGIALNSAHTEIINSYLAEFKLKGGDSQAICAWNGPGPFRIVNNYLEGSGENVMFGGANPGIPDLVPSDIELRGNHFAKPAAWRGVWMVKNLLELKFARRVVIEGNLFENNWADGQTGFAILFKVANPGRAPWVSTEDVQFINNIVRHVGAGISILGHDYQEASGGVKNLLIRNNLFEDVGAWAGSGRFLSITEGADNVAFDHNTILQTGPMIIADSEKANANFVWTNNLAPHNKYGVIGNGIGNPTLTKFFPNAIFRRNVLAGGRAALYPADNFFPAKLDDVRFVNQENGDYRLAPDSPYRVAGTDGLDVGCVRETIDAAISRYSSEGAPPVQGAPPDDDFIPLPPVTSGSPIIYTAEDGGTPNEALALDALTLRRATSSERGALGNNHPRPEDGRLMFFSKGVTDPNLNKDTSNDVRDGNRTLINVAEAVIAEIRAADGRVWKAVVEYAGPLGTYPGLDQVIIVLPAEALDEERVEVTLYLNERESNTVNVFLR